MSDAAAVSLTERLAFERLLGDLSALFADVPAERVIDEIGRALGQLLDFLGFDRGSFGEFTHADRAFEVLCSLARDRIEPRPEQSATAAALVFRRTAGPAGSWPWMTVLPTFPRTRRARPTTVGASGGSPI